MSQRSLRQTEEGFERITRELNEERAAALRRISRTLESLIDQMHAIRARIESTRSLLSTRPMDAAERSQEIALYADLRRKALQYRWYLEVQREALGLRYHHRLDEFYKIPGAIDV
jgi:hypothetical protein